MPLGIVGYARPESIAAARWAGAAPAADGPDVREPGDRPDPRVWWKELIKRRRIRLFDAAVVGGPAHRDYLVQLGMPPDRITLGYNAVDNAYFAAAARRWRNDPAGARACPRVPYFLAVCRFVPEKNLVRLVEAFARYRRSAAPGRPWELVLCGDGPGREQVETAVATTGLAGLIHRPGLPPGRGTAALVCPRGCVRAAEPARALGARRQRGGRERAAAPGIPPRRLCRDARAGSARDHRCPLRPAGRPGARRGARAGSRARPPSLSRPWAAAQAERRLVLGARPVRRRRRRSPRISPGIAGPRVATRSILVARRSEVKR